MSNNPSNVDLFRAVREMDEKTFLSRPDIDLNVRGDYSRTLLHEAIAFGRLIAAAGLIEKGSPLEAQDSKGQTPLHYAATFSLIDIARLILSHGGNPNALDKSGNNPLWTAALLPKKNYDLIELLVSQGADPAHKNGAGRSVLDFARQSENSRLWELCGGDAGGF